MTSTGKFISGIEFARNAFGLLTQPLKEALYNYYEFPSVDSWNDIYGLVISTGKVSTVWQAVLAVDSTFIDRIPKEAWEPDYVNWPQIPSREVFIKALNFALKQQTDKKFLN